MNVALFIQDQLPLLTLAHFTTNGFNLCGSGQLVSDIT